MSFHILDILSSSLFNSGSQWLSPYIEVSMKIMSFQKSHIEVHFAQFPTFANISRTNRQLIGLKQAQYSIFRILHKHQFGWLQIFISTQESFILWITLFVLFFVFLHCVFLSANSNCLPEKMQNHIGCIGLTFLHCVFSDDSAKHLH